MSSKFQPKEQPSNNVLRAKTIKKWLVAMLVWLSARGAFAVAVAVNAAVGYSSSLFQHFVAVGAAIYGLLWLAGALLCFSRTIPRNYFRGLFGFDIFVAANFLSYALGFELLIDRMVIEHTFGTGYMALAQILVICVDLVFLVFLSLPGSRYFSLKG